MTPEKIVKALLDADSAVAALASTRLYDQTRPESGALPAVVWELISDVAEPPIRAGAGTQPAAARLQVNCLASTVAAAKTLAQAVIAACDLKSGTYASATVLAVFCNRGPSSYDREVETYLQPVDVLIHYLR